MQRGNCVRDRQDGSVFHLHGRIYATISPQEKLIRSNYSYYCCFELMEQVGEIGENQTIVLPVPDVENISLEQVYLFDSKLNSLMQSSPDRNVVACLGSTIHRRPMHMVFLGCHLILSHRLNFEDTLLALKPVHNIHGGEFSSMIENVLRGVCCSKCLNWIGFTTDVNHESEPELQIDEYMHYAR
jgi:hypothetical protein